MNFNRSNRTLKPTEAQDASFETDFAKTIEQLNKDIQTINNAIAGINSEINQLPISQNIQTANISNLNSENINVDKVFASEITGVNRALINNEEVNNLDVKQDAQVKNLSVSGDTTLQNVNAQDITGNEINASKVSAHNFDVDNLDIEEANITNVNSQSVDTTSFTADDAHISDIAADNAEATQLVVTNLDAANASIGRADVTDFYAESVNADNALVKNVQSSGIEYSPMAADPVVIDEDDVLEIDSASPVIAALMFKADDLQVMTAYITGSNNHVKEPDWNVTFNGTEKLIEKIVVSKEGKLYIVPKDGYRGEIDVYSIGVDKLVINTYAKGNPPYDITVAKNVYNVTNFTGIYIYSMSEFFFKGNFRIDGTIEIPSLTVEHARYLGTSDKVTADSEGNTEIDANLEVTGKVTVNTAPTDDNDVIRKTELDAAVMTLTEALDDEIADRTEDVYNLQQNKQDTLTFDDSPIEGSANPVTSEGIYNALRNKQDTLTFDTIPKAGSNNPVTSDGIQRYVLNNVSKVGQAFIIKDSATLNQYVNETYSYVDYSVAIIVPRVDNMEYDLDSITTVEKSKRILIGLGMPNIYVEGQIDGMTLLEGLNIRLKRTRTGNNGQIQNVQMIRNCILRGGDVNQNSAEGNVFFKCGQIDGILVSSLPYNSKPYMINIFKECDTVTNIYMSDQFLFGAGTNGVTVFNKCRSVSNVVYKQTYTPSESNVSYPYIASYCGFVSNVVLDLTPGNSSSLKMATYPKWFLYSEGCVFDGIKLTLRLEYTGSSSNEINLLCFTGNCIVKNVNVTFNEYSESGSGHPNVNVIKFEGNSVLDGVILDLLNSSAYAEAVTGIRAGSGSDVKVKNIEAYGSAFCFVDHCSVDTMVGGSFIYLIGYSSALIQNSDGVTGVSAQYLLLPSIHNESVGAIHNCTNVRANRMDLLRGNSKYTSCYCDNGDTEAGSTWAGGSNN